MAMDWIEIQYRVRDYRLKFSAKSLTEPRIESAKSKDIGEQAKQIDAVIRAISRRGRDPEGIFGVELERRLTDLEKDILAIRLDWAFQLSTYYLSVPGEVWPYGEELTEDEFEQILISQWHAVGREKYQTAQQRIDSILEKQGIIQSAKRKPPQSDSLLGKQPPPPPDEHFGRR
jgi:hypothetical protein